MTEFAARRTIALPKIARLGPYEIVSLIGAGAMGEVYRARDPRLSRDVAIKIIPATFAGDAERVRRFEAEARAAGQLNHPNVLTIYDVGTQDGSPFIVSELLEGETLRQRLAGGSLPTRNVVDFGAQIARGLAAAHDGGVVHRDLKPENLFITRDERVKILDFGLAKLREPDAPPKSTAAPTGLYTEPGTVMGTVAYMSPEQVRAQPLDHRSDIFSLGSILYEMSSGHCAFRAESTVETMGAILTEDPPDLVEQAPSVPPGLERVVRHCLEKKPDARWQTARDLAFALESLSGATTVLQGAAASAPAARRVARPWLAVAAGLAIAAAAAVAFEAGQRVERHPAPTFQRLTFSRGTVWSARFAHEGGTIAYSASWDGKPVELFSTRADGPESRPLGIVAADVFAVSSRGEMALLLKPGSPIEWAWKWGTLARASLAGGDPRETLEHVQFADWGPDSASLAVVRAAGTRSRVEFPIGKALYETPDRIGALRVSPSGTLLALADRPAGLGSRWSISILDLKGRITPVSTGWAGDLIDLAWSPSSEEIWFDMRQGGDDGLHAVTISGAHRLVARLAAPVQLFDVARDGRALVARAFWRAGVVGLPPSATNEVDLSWLDASEVDDVSFDGRLLLLTEFGEGGGVGRSSVYVRRVDGSPAVRLGDGQAFAFSPDGNRVLALRRSSPPELVIWPTGPGQPAVIRNPQLTDYNWADWLPDGRHIVFNAIERGYGPRCYIQAVDGGAPRAITPEGTTLFLGQRVVSPDGAWAVAIRSDGRPALYEIDGAGTRPIPGVEPGDVPIRWTVDERALFVFRKIEEKPRVYRVDLTTGRNELWKEIVPADAAGLTNIWGVHIAPDERSYYYSYMRTLSDLYLVRGLR